MADIVFILGAGASQEAGGPLMNDFLDIANSLLETKKVGDKADFFKRVFDAISALQVVHSKSQLDLTNIESVFNALEMARILKKFPGPDGFSVEDTIEALKQLIACTLEQTILFPVEYPLIKPPLPYGRFAELLNYITKKAHPTRSVAVLTFNYDIAADYALLVNQLEPNYYLESDRLQGIPLLKLHGSINWAVCEDCGKVIPWYLQNFFEKFNTSSLENAKKVIIDIWSKFHQFQHCRKPVKSLPLLVPPTWNKTDHYEEIQKVWVRAAIELADAENIFIIGYSLPPTDSFFPTLYALGTAGGKPLKRIWVFNPDKDNVENRFRDLLGPGAASRFEYFHSNFREALIKIREEFH